MHMHQVSVEKFKHFYEETWTQPQGFAGVEVQGEDGLQVRRRLPLGASPPPFGCFSRSLWVLLPHPVGAHPPSPPPPRPAQATDFRASTLWATAKESDQALSPVSGGNGLLPSWN